MVIDHAVDVILHCGAYFRDRSFYSWHHFAISRAIENQVYLLSLNRAGSDYGRSLFCPPWADERRTPVTFAEYDEEFLRLQVRRDEIEQARRTYSFLADRLQDYGLPVTFARTRDLALED